MEHRSGQTIIEALVGITVAVVGLLGILILVGRSLTVNNDIRAKFVATYLAAEGIEVVKNIIDTNYANGTFWNRNIDTGDFDVSWDSLSLTPTASRPLNFGGGAYSYVANPASPYTRTVSIVAGASTISVKSLVSWTSRGKTESISLEDTFFNWR